MIGILQFHILEQVLQIFANKISSIFDSAIPRTIDADIASRFKNEVKDMIIKAIAVSNENA